MKALVYTGVETLSFQDAPEPQAAPGQALVRVASVGICGSDMHAYLGHDDRRPAPLILGHEAAGHIVGGARDGERVTINPLVSCGTCRTCKQGRENLCPERVILSMPPREGAFAEFVTISEDNLVTVPDAVTFDQASLAEPLAVCWHAVRLVAEQPWVDLATQPVLVIGGGAIGLGSALALRAFGAKNILLSEPSAERRAFIEAHEGIACAAPGDIENNAFDVCVDAVGFAGTRAQACAAVRPGGVVAHIGLGDGEGGVDVRRLTLQEITFFGTYTYTPKDFRDTCAAMFDGRFGGLGWMETRGLSGGAQAFADLRAGRVEAPKIVLHPGA